MARVLRLLLSAALGLVLFGLTGFVVLAFAYGDPLDVLRAYTSPGRHAGSARLVEGADAPRERDQGDYDGDGVLDALDCVRYRMEPIGGVPSSYLAVVRCGRTGERLLVDRSVPLSSPRWAGDVDGNGTDDVWVASGHGPAVVWGRVEPAAGR